MELEEAARVYADASAEYAKAFPDGRHAPDQEEHWRKLWDAKYDAEAVVKKCVDDMRRWRERRVEDLAATAKAEELKPPIQTQEQRTEYHLMLFAALREYMTVFAPVDNALPHRPHEKVFVKISIRQATAEEVALAQRDFKRAKDSDSIIIVSHDIEGDQWSNGQDYIELYNHDE